MSERIGPPFQKAGVRVIIGLFSRWVYGLMSVFGGIIMFHESIANIYTYKK